MLGADYTDRVRSRRGHTRHTGWQPIEEFVRSVDFDFGVIPLRPSQFNDSKSDLAMVEMAALQVPVVATDTGPYRRAVDAGAPALLASTPAEWTKHMTALLDEQYRTELGAAAHGWARTRTIQAQGGQWERAYVEARSGRRAAA
jgi:glycosyltransferase involved in cell wall biosynthesis